ncbi:VOC family protein [Actinomadura sp. J1-007]|uniref:VOC family protein n=1 Tax=Actinomadura sp. J1-007 TaxID=2661913 RepID=UPI001F4F742C|nr:VOC family protein [Actinomadura sp. J1-007]
MFGWRFTLDPDEDGYDLITYPGAERPSGGVQHTGDAADNHALFVVLVEDVGAACADTERHGGKVAVPARTTEDGLTFAYLEDPSGNRFGVFTPRPPDRPGPAGASAPVSRDPGPAGGPPFPDAPAPRAPGLPAGPVSWPVRFPRTPGPAGARACGHPVS